MDKYDVLGSWDDRSTSEDWVSIVKSAVWASERACSQDELKRLPSLNIYSNLKLTHGLEDWMGRNIAHSGVRLRFQLRSDTAPLMDRVGARAKVPKSFRTCVFCGADEIENVEHFLCRCPYYDDLL